MAFAYHLAVGDDVKSMALDQHKLRKHLAKCFEKKRLSRFPRDKREVPCNAMVECFNQTLALVKKAHDDQHNWDRHINSVLFGYRTSAQKSTKMTPFFVMHLREANLGLDVNQPKQEPDSEEDMQQN